jgi:hypothetical protein
MEFLPVENAPEQFFVGAGWRAIGNIQKREDC